MPLRFHVRSVSQSRSGSRSTRSQFSEHEHTYSQSRYIPSSGSESGTDDSECDSGCDCDDIYSVIMTRRPPRRRSPSYERGRPLLQQNVNLQNVNLFPGQQAAQAQRATNAGADGNHSHWSHEYLCNRIRQLRRCMHGFDEGSDCAHCAFDRRGRTRTRFVDDSGACRVKGKKNDQDSKSAKGKKHSNDLGQLRRLYAGAGHDDAPLRIPGHRTEEEIQRDIARCDMLISYNNERAALHARLQGGDDEWEAAGATRGTKNLPSKSILKHRVESQTGRIGPDYGLAYNRWRPRYRM